MKYLNFPLSLNLLKTSLFILSFLALVGCSKENGNAEEGEMSKTVDLAKIEGDYVGNLSSPLVTFAVSAELQKLSNDRFSVDLYESSDFKPMYNSDGVTPEVKGIITVNGTTVTTDLNLKSDIPECTGTYIGNGTRDNTKGVFTIQISYEETCNGDNFDGEFTYTLTKLRD